MGFFKAPKAQQAVQATGPSAEQIRSQEEAKIREQNKQSLLEQEKKRATLRGRLRATEDEGEIGRKRLFGE